MLRAGGEVFPLFLKCPYTTDTMLDKGLGKGEFVSNGKDLGKGNHTKVA